MGFDKAKVMRAAEKSLAQGKISAAIKEYRQIVEHDENDFTALNMLGDLYARTNAKPEAIQCFTRIAEHYREQGFALKAIAMYKKIDRLNPGNSEIANALAALYETQGLVADARAQYLLVADALTQAKQPQQAIDVLRRVIGLDPNNADIRLKLAEAYQRENMRAEAAQTFAEAGAQLLSRGAFERARQAYTQALNLNPRDHDALHGLLNAHIARGTPNEAAVVLKQAVADQPDDVDLLAMLVRAYLEAENPLAAERATATLVQQQPASYPLYVDVARLYLKKDNIEATFRVLESISEQMLSGREENQLIEVLQEVLARHPEHARSWRLLIRIYQWQRDYDKLHAALEQFAEVAAANQLEDEERYALSQLVRLSPEERRFAERLEALGGAPEGTGEDSPVLFPPPPSSEEVPSFESFTAITEESVIEPPPTGSAIEDVAEFEWNSVEAPPSATPPATASVSFADLNEWTDEGSAAASSFSQSATTESAAAADFQEFDFGSTLNEAPPATESVSPDSLATPFSSVSDPRHEAMWRQELESVDFYIAQGYSDIASDTLDMLERQFGAHQEIAARREQLKNAAPPPTDFTETATPLEETIEFSGFTRYDVAEETPVVEDVAVMPDDAFAPLTAQPEEAPKAATNPAGGLDPGLAAIFDEFRTAVEEDETLSNGDYETHYNLGLAYKDMDLMDEAIEEFQSAINLVAPQDGTPRYLQCCNLLGHCFMQKGMPQLAATWFKKGLDAPGHTVDEYQALRYELGIAYERMGDLDRAIDVFTEIYGINVSYRRVSDKLRELQAQRATK